MCLFWNEEDRALRPFGALSVPIKASAHSLLSSWQHSAFITLIELYLTIPQGMNNAVEVKRNTKEKMPVSNDT